MPSTPPNVPSGAAAPLLELEQVTVRYGDLTAVDSVSLDLAAGQVLAVLGPSGCGKSTLLRAVAGLEPVAGGTVRFAGEDLAGRPTHKRGFALMFQDGQLFDHLSVARNVGYALRLRRLPRREVAGRVAGLLDLVGLSGYGDRAPTTLSGGERQRVALARALAVEPRLLLLDEPLSALDSALRTGLAADLRRIVTEAGTTAVMVTHDHDEAFAVADRIAVMSAGEVVQEGPIGQVWQQPRDAATARFLGYATVLDGAEADRVAAAAGLPTGRALALRRSALQAVPDDGPADRAARADRDPDGAADAPPDPEAPLTATVAAARVTPEQLRLRVDVPGVGELDAVAPLDQHVGVGETVRLRVDPTRTARIPSAPRRPGVP